ncbi:carcinoembryonic antigen-related cell adhesion molecule 3-like isoform X1 [Huso huso]|uniref:Carcinoembryonic antigen-related cell adhesion molecule 3-like isoform X1 n=1 Tax=Huso huso TaxID=61971 RepID=A0ABR0YU81_HUSHU
MINLNKFIPYWLFLFSLNAYVTAENIRVPVYGALGDSVHLHFNTTLNSSVEVQWKRGVYRIGVFKNNRTAFDNPYKNRAEIFANGTLRLNRTQKDDSGDYSVDVFNTDGTNIFKGSMQVYIQVTAENISVPVYGALGDSVYLHFNTTLNSSVEVQWKRGDKPIGVFKNNRMAFNNPYINRTEIFADGTLRLNRTQKGDTGDYSVDVFNTDGTNIFKRSMQVYIQEAVSQPVIHSTCLSHGEVLLVCTVDKGDNASFNWSLDGVPLNPSLAYFSDEEHVVILKKHVSGNLVCIATNQVSTNQSDSVIPNCSEAVSQPVVHSSCLSHGEVLLVCTVDKGDNASFSWSLDGVPLNTSLAYFSDKEHIVILKKNVTGDLVCIAKNQINEEMSDSVKSNCSGKDKAIQVRLVYGSLAFVILTIFPITLHCNSWKSNSKGKQRTYLEMKMRKKENEHFIEEQI